MLLAISLRTMLGIDKEMIDLALESNCGSVHRKLH